MQQKFQSSEFLLLSFYHRVSGGQKLNTAPMAQGMNHIVYVTLRSARQCLKSIKQNMTKAFNEGSAGQNKNVHEPKVIGEVLNDMLQSDSPFAVAYRQHHATVYPNTEPCIDLKLLTRQPGRILIGDYLDGALTRDGDDHYLFIENATDKKRQTTTQRNPHIYEGRFINVNRKPDGTPYPTFNRPQFTADFTFKHFCLAAAEELLAVAGIISDAQ